MVTKQSEAWQQLAIGGVLFLLAFMIIFPFFYIFSVSFTDGSVYQIDRLALWPEKWSTDAYQFVLSGKGFISSFYASIFITCIGTPLAILISCMMAYMLSKNYLPGRKYFMYLIIFTMLFSPGIIPNYSLVKEIGLLNSWWAIILPAATNAWTLLVMKSFFQGIPFELEESAKMDGSGDLQTFFRIILPLSKAPLAAFSLFFAVALWNTYFNAMIYLTDTLKWPLQVFLQQVVVASSISQFTDDSVLAMLTRGKAIPPEVVKMAAVVVVTLPIICVYPFLQKYFAKGVLIGSVKG